MKNYEGRLKELKTNLNKHLTKLTGLKKDYYQEITQTNLVKLKTLLSDINNIFTLKLTLSALDWICLNFKIDNILKTELLKKIDAIKPNTNGFDIIIEEYKIVAEVKCVFPSNNGNKYLAAQRNGILDDAIKLIKGKKQISNTSDYFKFLFVINVGPRTDNAIDSLLKHSVGRTENILRNNRHKIKENIELLKSKNISELNTKVVYLKTLKFK